MIVSLPDLKAHLRVDFDDDDGVISSLGLAAQVQVANWIGRQIYATAADLPQAGDPRYSPHQIVADPTVIVAIKLLVARLYQDLGGEGNPAEDAVPPTTVRALLSGVRLFSESP